MYAYQLTKTRDILLTEVPSPHPDVGEIKIRTLYTSICATDVAHYQGQTYITNFPVIPCHEYVGEIVENRTDEPHLKPGELVTYWGQTDFGALAEYRVVRPISSVKKTERDYFTDRSFNDVDAAAVSIVPKSMRVSHASMSEPLTAVLRSVGWTLETKNGRALVLGSGTCGLLACQILSKLFGFHVDMIDIDEKKCSRSILSGCEQFFVIPDQKEHLQDIASRSRGSVYDYVFDALPGFGETHIASISRECAMSLLRPNGTYTLFSASEKPQMINTWLILSKGINIKAAPFDISAFPMQKTQIILNYAVDLLSRDCIDLNPLNLTHISFLNQKEVKQSFSSYTRTSDTKIVIEC